MKIDTNENEAELDIDIETTGEDNSVETELEDAEATTNNKLQALKAKLKACETEKMENLEQLQRTKADFLNARKRLEEERLNDRHRMNEEHVLDLIPLYDSFATAMSHKDVWNAVDKKWRIGVEGIFGQLQGLFSSYNVIIDVPTGKAFDPKRHDAIKNELVDDETQHDIIMNVVQAGFIRKGTTGDIVIRPARVIVGTFKQ